MKKFFRPACLLLYLLAPIVFFVLGAGVAGVSGAGEGQGLAGGAIVFFYAVIAAGLGFISALAIAGNAQLSQIVKINKILGVLFVILAAIIAFRFYEQKQEKDLGNNIEHNFKQTPTALPKAQLVSNNDMQSAGIGLGIFVPNLSATEPLYFLGYANNKNADQGYFPTDSVVFYKNDRLQYEITSAPPWLVPEHLKLDYDVLYFKAMAASRDLIEIIGNAQTNKTVLVRKSAGTLMYWPEFLLSVHTVEFVKPEEQKIYYKPLDHASIVTTRFEFMRPLKVQDHWMQVELQDHSFKAIGTGWIVWRDSDNLLVSYSLFS